MYSCICCIFWYMSYSCICHIRTYLYIFVFVHILPPHIGDHIAKSKKTSPSPKKTNMATMHIRYYRYTREPCPCGMKYTRNYIETDQVRSEGNQYTQKYSERNLHENIRTNMHEICTHMYYNILTYNNL